MTNCLFENLVFPCKELGLVRACVCLCGKAAAAVAKEIRKIHDPVFNQSL